MNPPATDIRQYGLLELPERTDCEIVREVLQLWQKRVGLVYTPDMVDWQIGQGCILLCSATRDHLYSDFTPLELQYRPGSRPVLEQILQDRIRAQDCRSQRELALAIMRFVRDLPGDPRDPMDLPYYGGSEEDVIEKQSGLCNEQARVLIVLAQIAGLPARYVGHIPGDHGTTEIYVDGGWAYFDVRGQYFIKPDGRLASFAEIKQNPALIESQSPEVLAEIRPGYSLESIREFARPQCMTFIGNYFAWEQDRYGFGHVPRTPQLDAARAATDARWKELKERLYNQPPVYA